MISSSILPLSKNMSQSEVLPNPQRMKEFKSPMELLESLTLEKSAQKTKETQQAEKKHPKVSEPEKPLKEKSGNHSQSRKPPEEEMKKTSPDSSKHEEKIEKSFVSHAETKQQRGMAYSKQIGQDERVVTPPTPDRFGGGASPSGTGNQSGQDRGSFGFNQSPLNPYSAEIVNGFPPIEHVELNL